MSGKVFKLGGTEYQLSIKDVEQGMKGVRPKPIGKYCVAINGIEYPPKQVVAKVLQKDLVSFTTMDATRILTALGFEVRKVRAISEPSKNKSELLFEQYLSMSGLARFEFEKMYAGTRARPDYSVVVADDSEIVFEVKEFRATAADFLPGGGGAYDPYLAIREKIDQARDKFKEFKDRCCCLVLFNQEKPLVDLSWRMVYGAMLGDLGFRIPLNIETGIMDDTKTEQVFTTRGKMLRYKALQPVAVQNQTISAILVLDLLPIGRMRFEAYVRKLESERGEQMPVEEFTQLLEAAHGTDRDLTLMQLRGVIHENPYARIKFPSDLFQGFYDERYGEKDGLIQRLFAGAGVRRLSEEEIEGYR